MEYEIFKAGVAPGAPATEDEIKMLLCYILSNTDRTMSFAQLYEALSENNLINYFELVRVLEKLAALGHLHGEPGADGADEYTVTDLGREAAEQFTRTLPASVRDKALAASKRVLDRERRLGEVSVRRAPHGEGYQLTFSIPEPEGELISFTLYAPSEEQADLLRRRFLNAPATIYRGVLALLTGNREVLGEIFGGEEPLF